MAAVVTDIRGVSARAILATLIDGEADLQTLAEMARGRLRSKREQLAQAMVGFFTSHHAFMLTEQLSHLDYLDEAMARISAEIAQRLVAAAQEESIVLLDTIPGVSQRAAEILIAEIGIDMTRFPSAKHLAWWAGMCPGHDASEGKRRSARPAKS